MDVIRTEAVRTLTELSVSLPPAKKAALARDYHIEEWVLPALVELARRKEPMSLEEGNTLGMDWTVKMARVRESYAPTVNVNAPMYSAFGD